MIWSIVAEIRQVQEFKDRAEHFHRTLETTEPNIYDQLAEITEKKIALLKKANNIPVILREVRDLFLTDFK